MQRSNLFTQLVQAATVLVLELGADLVQRHEGMGAVYIVLDLFGKSAHGMFNDKGMTASNG